MIEEHDHINEEDQDKVKADEHTVQQEVIDESAEMEETVEVENTDESIDAETVETEVESAEEVVADDTENAVEDEVALEENEVEEIEASDESSEMEESGEEESEGEETGEESSEGAEDGESGEEEAEEEEEEKPEPLTRWYSLRVISGKERKIKERIELEIERNNWQDFVTQVLVPSEKVYKIRNGKKVILERNILPGYILVEALPSKFSGEIVQAIANIPNVIHFLGRNNPIPMQQSEANRMLGKVDDSQDIGETMIEPFIEGETVKIIDGPFSEFVGDIQEVNEEKKKLKVIVKIFGRGTEVELNFMQVEKNS